MTDIDIVVRRYYEGKLEDLDEELSKFPAEDLAEYIDNLLNRVSDAMRFALTATYGYEDVE